MRTLTQNSTEFPALSGQIFMNKGVQKLQKNIYDNHNKDSSKISLKDQGFGQNESKGRVGYETRTDSRCVWLGRKMNPVPYQNSQLGIGPFLENPNDHILWMYLYIYIHVCVYLYIYTYTYQALSNDDCPVNSHYIPMITAMKTGCFQ